MMLRWGGFLQEDPFRGFLRHPQTQNRYSYTQNNPINFKDPFGLHTYIDRGKTPDGGNRYDVYDDKGNYTETITTDKPAIYDVAEGAGVCVDKALNNPATEALDKIPPWTTNNREPKCG